MAQGFADSQLTNQTVGYIKPQWSHPYLVAESNQIKLNKAELQAYAYDFYLRFLPFFKNQPEGSLGSGVVIEFTQRMRHKLGLANLFARSIKLNQRYFSTDPKLLPYTLFHELTHLFLYDCYFDPGHTRRFYLKMKDFERTGLPIDKQVHIHRRIANESRYVYVCPGCDHRWYVNERAHKRLSCGHCWEHKEKTEFPLKHLNRRKAMSCLGLSAKQFFEEFRLG